MIIYDKSGDIEIEDGVPIPTRFSKHYEVMNKLEVGQSFVTDFTPSLQTNIYTRSKPSGKRFVTRKLPNKKLRIWRVN
jgi:hypothetical protein